MSEWSIYLVRCADGSLYTGIATDVQRRFGEHESGRKGSKYLRGRSPLTLYFQHPVGDRSQASRAEYFVRKLPRSVKEDVTALPGRIAKLLEES